MFVSKKMPNDSMKRQSLIVFMVQVIDLNEHDRSKLGFKESAQPFARKRKNKLPVFINITHDSQPSKDVTETNKRRFFFLMCVCSFFAIFYSFSLLLPLQQKKFNEL